ncbi:MAG: hypothetical protein HUU50_19245 [Candidatus Brocadiae bacterium]|nr:hypothetical protein [Candidatus Brocadiia bacterium]
MIEALIAAIYLDKGLEIAKKSLLRVMEMEKITEDLSLDFLDPIGILQEFLAQKNILPPVYKIMKISGTEHEPVFEIEAACVIQSRTFRAIGHGKSKKDASKEAAHKLLETLKKTDQKHTIEESVIKDQESCLQRLHILLAKRGMKLPLYREIMNDNQDSLFIIEASCDGKGIFFKETGKGHSKKMAKQAAAQKILDKLQ